MEAIKILSGNRAAVSKTLDASSIFGRIDCGRSMSKSSAKKPIVPTCKQREFPWLAGREGSRSAVLCGRNSVQLTHAGAKLVAR